MSSALRDRSRAVLYCYAMTKRRPDPVAQMLAFVTLAAFLWYIHAPWYLWAALVFAYIVDDKW